jgi:predicted phosphate transport protein (TIGR00153 family)
VPPTPKSPTARMPVCSALDGATASIGATAIEARKERPTKPLYHPARMRLSLVPRTTEFYDLFTAAGANALEAARKAEERFRDYPNASVSQSEIKEIEHEGDRITRDLVQLLNTQYITPFDREDIYELATTLDDIVDLIEEASDLLELYGVEQPTKHALEQCRILVSAVEYLDQALRELKGLRGVQAPLVELKRMEDEGDRVLREAIAALFHDPRIDPLLVIRWKDIFDALEGALDACETAANVVANIAVKNA